MILTKKKKILLFSYNNEVQRLYLKEYKDKDKKPLEIQLKEIPYKIKWYGENIFYYLKQESKVIFNIIETNKDVSRIKQGEQAILIEDIAFIQS